MTEWLSFTASGNDQAFVEALTKFKAAVPSTSRRFDKTHSRWVFDPKFDDQVAAIPGGLVRPVVLEDDDRALGRVPVRDDEELDTTLIDSQFGDRVLFSAQLQLAEHGPSGLSHLVGAVVGVTDQDEPHVRGILRQHRSRFTKLPDGRIALSEEALR